MASLFEMFWTKLFTFGSLALCLSSGELVRLSCSEVEVTTVDWYLL